MSNVNKDLIKLSPLSKEASELKHQCRLENKSTQNKTFYRVSCSSQLYKKLYSHDSKEPNASGHSSARMIRQFMSDKDVMFIEGPFNSIESLYFTVSNNESPALVLGL